jgi:hypothetical protein
MVGEMAQVQPVPCMETAVSPAGRLSTWAMGAKVLGPPPVFLTVMV